MDRLKKILSKVLEIEENSITGETSLDNVASWDSFNHLLLISEIEKEFKMKFTMQEVIDIKSVKDIKTILKKHGVILEK